MEKEFWLERWQRQEIGFHQDEINPYLRRYWTELKLARDATIFVPLCGKSRDMLWLHEQGHAVLGVELSPLAVHAFFEENGVVPTHSTVGNFDCCDAEGFRILCGDFFDLQRGQLGGIVAVYDRASLVALPPEMRARYASHLVGILTPGTKILLVTFDYPQHEMTGPPFAVTPEEVEALYRGRAAIRLLSSNDALAQNPRFAERGVSRMQENIYLLTVG